jgi:predicted Zn-dependent protease
MLRRGFIAAIVAATLLIPLGAVLAQPPDLQKIIFVDYVGPVHKGPSGDACGDGTGKYTTLFGGIGWKSFPVSYYIDSSNTNGVTPIAAKNAVVSAFNTWDNQEHPAGNFFTETNDQSSAKIKVRWQFIDGTGNVLAQTSLTYNSATKSIVSADIIFDNGDNWFISNALNCGSVGSSFDVEDVAAHEIGHAIGLGHVNDTVQTMYRYASPGETLKRILGKGDLRGLDKIY